MSIEPADLAIAKGIKATAYNVLKPLCTPNDLTLTPLVITAYADGINTEFDKQGTSMLEIALTLVHAEENLDEKDYKKLLNSLSLDMRSIQRLKKIAQHPYIIANHTKLPKSWATLYELSKLEEEALKELVNSGRVTTSTIRREVTDLLKSVDSQSDISNKPTNHRLLSVSFDKDLNSLTDAQEEVIGKIINDLEAIGLIVDDKPFSKSIEKANIKMMRDDEKRVHSIVKKRIVEKYKSFTAGITSKNSFVMQQAVRKRDICMPDWDCRHGNSLEYLVRQYDIAVDDLSASEQATLSSLGWIYNSKTQMGGFLDAA